MKAIAFYSVLLYYNYMKNFLYFLLKILCWLPFVLLFPTRVIGRKKLPKGKCIFVANHQSGLDPCVFIIYFGRKMNFLAKQELFRSKFSSGFFKCMGAIPTDRKNVGLDTIKQALNVLNKNGTLALFPEGTRRKISLEEGAALKNGAAMFALKTGAAIVPMYFKKKPGLFRFNTLKIGDALDLSAFAERKATRENIASVGKLIEANLLELKNSFTKKKGVPKTNALKYSDKQKIKLVKADYNAIANKYAESYSSTEKYKDFVDNYLGGLNSGKKLLDLCCGAGNWTDYFHQMGYDACGMDFSQNLLKIAKERNARINFMCADIIKAKFPAQLDGVFCKNGLFHLPPKAMERVICKVYNSLKDCGKFCVIMVSDEGKDFGEQVFEEELDDKREIYYNYVSEDKLKQLLLSAGFKHISSRQADASSVGAGSDKGVIMLVAEK